MKYGVFSDIHGNLEALVAALSDMSREGVEKYWCLGDLVGYGANPNECVEKVRQLADMTVLGNHDAACVGLEDTSSFNRYAREACDWTAAQLLPFNSEWLRSLPLTATADDVFLVHASPFEPKGWHYMLYISDMINGFKSLTAPMAFIGHSHQPIILVHRGEEFFSFSGDEFHCEEGTRCIVNVGSIGQPRDGNPAVCYAIWDSKERMIKLKRVAYDVEAAQRKIRAAGLPDILASRLEFGN